MGQGSFLFRDKKFSFINNIQAHYRAFIVTLSHHTTLEKLLWRSDQTDADTSTWQHTTATRDRLPCHWRNSNPQSQQESGRRLTP